MRCQSMLATSLVLVASLVLAQDIVNDPPKSGGGPTTILPASTINQKSLTSRAAFVTSSLRKAYNKYPATSKTSSSTKKKTTTTTKKKTTTTTKKKTTTTKKVTVKSTAKKPAAVTTRRTTTTTKKTTKKTSTKKTTTAAKNVIKAKVKRQAVSSGAGCTSLSNILYGYSASNDTGVNIGTGFITDTTLVGNSPLNFIPPAGYSTSFIGQVGGLYSTNYIGYVQLPSYNTSMCAAFCNNANGCRAFNIYAERTPRHVPVNGCTNPAPLAAITCALWGDAVTADTATNYGQYKLDFMVVITASNGYNKNIAPPRITNYTAPVATYGGLDLTSSVNGALAVHYIIRFDTNLCALQCQIFTTNARQNATNGVYTPCNYFQTNNVTYPSGRVVMQCILSSLTDPSVGGYVTNFTSGGASYRYTNSWGQALYPPDAGLTNITWSAAPTGDNASCSGMLPSTSRTVLSYNRVNYTIACGFDVQYSNDVGNATAPDFYSCMTLCDSFPGCSGYAYLGTTCYFKNLLNGQRSPTSASGVDMAWRTSAYAGFGASTVGAPVVFATVSSAWTGVRTATTTVFNNALTATVIIQTPGGTTGPAAGNTVYVESGTGTTVSTVTVLVQGQITTSIIYPTPTYCTTVVGGGLSNKGARYGFYNNSASGLHATPTYPAYNPQTVKTMTPYATGVATTMGVNFVASSTSALVYGTNLTTAQFSVVVISHTFYLYANRGTGYYSLNFQSVDNIIMVWVGGNALSGYTRANANIFYNYYGQQPNGDAGTGKLPSGTTSFWFPFGSYTPIRVQYGNGATDGKFDMRIYDPNGNSMMDGTALTMSGAVIASPCNVTLGARFPTFGAET